MFHKLPVSYNDALVVLSVVIAIVSAFVALAAVPRIHDQEAGQGRTTLWALAFGVSLGVGIWSMHFIAMLALILPIPVHFDVIQTLGSLLVAVGFATLGALPLRRGGEFGMPGLLGMGLLVGTGIAGMHYSGMAAMRMAAVVHFDMTMVVLSVLIAVVASTAALWIANKLGDQRIFSEPGIKAFAAVVMGLAVSAMHYTGMAAAHFYAQPDASALLDGLDKPLMVVALTVIVTLVQGSMLVTAALDESCAAARREIELQRDIKVREERWRNLLAFLPDAIGVNVGGILVYANPALVDMLGFETAEDVVGTTMLHYVHPDDRDIAIQRTRELRRTGQPVQEIEERFLRPNGEAFTAAVCSEPIIFDGKQASLVIIRDISELKQSKERMALLVQAVNQSAEPIMILDLEGRVQDCNRAAAEVYGLEPDTIIGCQVAELRGGMVGDSIYEAIIAHIRQGKSWLGELTLKKQNDVRFLSRHVSPVFDACGNVTHQIVIDRDITDERTQQHKLEHTQRLESLGVLAGGIAHDFNNILTAIMGNAAMAERSLAPTSPAKDKLTKIETATQRAADLCKQMLAYSGKGSFIIKTVDISQQIEEMTHLMEVSIEKNVVIKYHLADNLPLVEVDSAQIQQVILNLITNANDAIGDKSGVISLSSGVMYADITYLRESLCGDEVPEGRYAYIEVSDTGCGMELETIKKIFDPFFTTKFTGRGLGMSATLGIVRGHHGALRVYSEVGQGTTFKVLLPTSDSSIKSVEKVELEQREFKATGTILIVDDEDTIREVAAMMLEDLGYATLTAENGLDAIEVYQAHKEDITAVLLDMTMPKMDGKACFRELRRINKGVKVILSSGYSKEDATSRFVGQGLSGFIQKPYSPEALNAVVRQVCGKAIADG